MIPTIGIMMGTYIITKMLVFLLHKEEKSVVVKIASIITILVSVLGIVGLFSSSSTIPTM